MTKISKSETVMLTEQDLGMMQESCFRHGEEGEYVKLLSVKDIVDTLQKEFPQVKKNHAFSAYIGRKLKEMRFLKGCSCYNVIPKMLARKEWGRGEVELG